MFRGHQCTYQFLFQSTHSRGVRRDKSSIVCNPKRFQSTHSRGVRHMPFRMPPALILFQSTHSRGVRHLSCSSSVSGTLFQSTHSRGVRHDEFVIIQVVITISIHALTRSATCHLYRCFCTAYDFNPRTHEECDVTNIIQ